MRKFLLLAMLTLGGCVQHYHNLKVTSAPSNAVFTVEAVDKDGKVVYPENSPIVGKTPYELTFRGEVSTAVVRVGDDAKAVSFAHGVETITTTRENLLLGLAICSQTTERLALNKEVHFDLAPVCSGCK